jgi:DNA polymerase-3 subunit epsilon
MGVNDDGRSRMRNAAIKWAQDLLPSDGWVILDTETTGLDTETAEIVEIALIDKTGAALLDRRVNPRVPIPSDSTRVHGITDQDVGGEATLEEIWPQITSVLTGKRVVIFNAEYDSGMLKHSAERHKLPSIPFRPVCAMNMYRRFRAVEDHVDVGVRRHKLETACRRHGLAVGGHSAAGDCRSTLALIAFMAQPQPAQAIAWPKTPVEPDVVEVNTVPGDSRRVEAWDTRSAPTLTDVSGQVVMAPEALRAVAEALSVVTSTRSENQGRAAQLARMHDPSFMQALYRESALNQATDLLEDSLYFLQHPESSGCRECRAPERGRCLLCSEPVCTTHLCMNRAAETWDRGWVCYQCSGEASHLGMIASD